MPHSTPHCCQFIAALVLTLVLICPGSLSNAYRSFCNGRNWDIINSGKTWPAAERDCVRRGSHLASFRNSADFNCVRAFRAVHDARWIGAHDDGNEGNFTWTSGIVAPIPRNWWQHSNPDNYYGIEHCASIADTSDRLLNDLACGRRRSYVCDVPVHGGWSGRHPTTCPTTCGVSLIQQRRTCTNPQPQFGGQACEGSNYWTTGCHSPACHIESDGICPDGWIAGTLKCYKRVNGLLTWSEAVRHCGGAGVAAKLLSIDSPQEQNEVNQILFRQNEHIWVNVKLGQYQQATGYVNWDVHWLAPHLVLNENCVVTQAHRGGLWLDGDCSHHFVVVCEKEFVQCSEWSTWSRCSISCGGGTRTQTRLCEGTQELKRENCGTEPCPLWTEFVNITGCMRPCGTEHGTQLATRNCVAENEATESSLCEGSSMKWTPCRNTTVKQCLRIATPCPSIAAPPYGTIVTKARNGFAMAVNPKSESGVFGTVITFECGSGYKYLNSNHTALQCGPNGAWEGIRSTCIPVCRFVTCPGFQTCRQNASDVHSHECVCDSYADCPFDFRPVCGSDAADYNNRCNVAVKACEDNSTLRVVRENFCEVAGRCSDVRPSEPSDRTCPKQFLRYFFNSTSNRCQEMYKGRCYTGGENEFKIRDQCVSTCENVDPCDVPQNPGPCTNTVQRHFYDKHTNTCKTFNYGGCYGSENNFKSQASCERTCKVQRCPVLTAPDNGQLTASRRNAGDEATYECNFGYEMRGSSTRYCQANGTWNGADTACQLPCPPVHCFDARLDVISHCSLDSGTPQQACTPSAKRNTHIALLARVKRGSTPQCPGSDAQAHIITLRVRKELFRSDECDFLPLMSVGRYDATLVQWTVNNGCPCPYSEQGENYMLTASCNRENKQLVLHQESLFKRHTAKSEERLISRCGY